MALTVDQRAKLLLVYLDFRANADAHSTMLDLWRLLGLSNAAFKAEAQTWLVARKARQQVLLTGADAQNTATKAALTSEINDLDAINTGL